jgi:hypothetical protein
MIDNDAFSSWIGLETSASKDALQERLQTWESDHNKLQYLKQKFSAFKHAFKEDPTFFPACKELFKEIAQIETKLHALMKEETELEKETYGELLFLKSYLQPFNFIPCILFLWSMIRIYIIPGLGLLIPLFILLTPYLLLTYLFHIPITFSNYTQILHSVISGNINLVYEEVQQDFAGTIKQCAIVAVTLIQGIIQPYWSYMHLQSVDSIIKENGHLIIRYKKLYQSLSNLLEIHGFSFFHSPLPSYNTEREATAHVILHSSYFKIALKYIGSLEVIMTLASQPDIHPVQWITSESPQFHGRNMFDFQVNNGKVISVTLDKQPHALLTGPNKGGKSTALRAITTSVLLAHTYGCSVGHVRLTPFSELCVCLKPDDLPGSKSRFEREIEFTANTLTKTDFTMVLIDELYHSTNPPDALRSCEIYCKQLWKKPNVVSIISTHLFEFVENATNSIQRLCCPATDVNGRVQFEYGLKEGICKVSSVDLLLEKNGLILETAS